MTGITVRPSTTADWARHHLLDAVAFGQYPSPGEAKLLESLVDPADLLLAWDGTEAVGTAMHFPFELTVPGPAVVPMRAITSVSVLPSHRRRGILRQLFDALHEQLEATDAPIAGLTATDAGIYGRFGFGPATLSQRLRIDRRFVRFRDTTQDPGGVRFVDADEARTLLPDRYERWRRSRIGGIPRPTAFWDNIFHDGAQPDSRAFYAVHPGGYFTYRQERKDGSLVARVDELFADDVDAHAALWRAMFALDLSNTVELRTHVADPVRLLLTDVRLPKVIGETDDLWLRILDVPAALRARSYSADVETVLEVRDPYRHAGGRFALSVRGDEVTAEPTTAPASIELDLDVLGSLYLGQFRARDFAIANRLRPADEAALAALDRAFADPRPALLGWIF